MIKIEKGIPKPNTVRRYPWRDMKVGDSFEVPAGMNPESFRHNAHLAGRRLNRKFSTRKFNGGYRCWRVE